MKLNLNLNMRMRAALGLVIGLAVFALAAPGVFAQGCAMCYQTAAGAPAQTQRALRHGILVLLFPPMFIFAGIIGMLYQRRNPASDEESGGTDSGE
jgi:hypothetical protein